MGGAREAQTERILSKRHPKRDIDKGLEGRYLRSTSRGTLSLPAVVIIFLSKYLTCSASSCGASTHKASWIIITIRAPILRFVKMQSRRTMAVFIKSASICCGHVTRKLRCTAGFARVSNRLTLPRRLFTERRPMGSAVSFLHCRSKNSFISTLCHALSLAQGLGCAPRGNRCMAVWLSRVSDKDDKGPRI